MKQKKNTRIYIPSIVTPPGYSLRDCIEEMELAPTQAAVLLGLTHEQLLAIFEGNMAIDEQLAEKLELHIGWTAKFWNARQADYFAYLERQKVKLDGILEKHNKNSLTLVEV